MAVTAKFEADFSQMHGEVDRMNAEFEAMEAWAGKSTTTASKGFAGMGTSVTKTTTQFNTLSQSFQQFDGVLNAVGIHLGPAVKGLNDISAASGKTTSQLGLLSTAGLLVGAAMAGWQIGRKIAELTGLDTAIANSVAKWAGWGDLVKATAGAQADVLALASKNAGRTITDINEARAINQKWVDDLKKGAKEVAKANEEQAKAMDAVRVAGQDNNAVLKTMSASTIAAAKAALDHGVALDTVATAYKLTASQIAAVEAALKSEQEAAKASEKEHARITAELKEHWDAVLAIRDKALGKDAIEKATQWNEALFLLGGTVDKLSKEQLTELQGVMTEAMTAMARNGNLTAEQAAAFNDFSVAAAAAETALRPVVTVTDDLVAAQAALVAENDAVLAAMYAVSDAAKKAKQDAEAAQNTWGLHPGGQAPASSGLKQVGDSMGNQFLVNPKTGEVIQKLERKFGDGFLGWGTPGPPPTVNLTVEGNILGTQNELARLIGDALTYNFSSGGGRLPA
jgi:hypothetical protein